jgi:hypothetical protein
MAAYYGHQCYEWFATGQLWTSGRLMPGRYITFGSDPVGFVISFGLDILMVLFAIAGMLFAISAE